MASVLPVSACAVLLSRVVAVQQARLVECHFCVATVSAVVLYMTFVHASQVFVWHQALGSTVLHVAG